ncbi:uncharacterized protein LOC108716737 [Xenopus laevis]|uniref:Uncharacterized protein LOC108716737 n=1 Tax=Xenopus laevis TaxID=8355 RepID=A0A8J0VB71_XENLA|nr:uncharacterized protein LOC108716737 [Xenopus laevis]XP_018118613.1 uncharacterized protein LOC108716737 [Xenopus laevis]XP_018118614.1 uncharacterized protein LOC108716737 [Xenopus laevis]XP_018118615.1 uncharacterized protein LOC108716737 [Xenopus laevis]XP_041418724.1 uncharacterized protein LOC108716737 [Xenopus laevis]
MMVQQICLAIYVVLLQCLKRKILQLFTFIVWHTASTCAYRMQARSVRVLGIKQSPKRNHLFDSLRKELEPQNQNLRTLCPTRWTVRTGAVKSVIDNYNVLCTAMTHINENSHDEHGRKACGILAVLEKFSTFYGLSLAYLVFSVTEHLSKTLQTVNITIHEAQKAVKLTQGFFSRQRTHECFANFFNSVIEQSKDLTDEPVVPRQKRPPRRIDSGADSCTFPSPQEYYRREYYEVLDLIDHELTFRFAQKDVEVAIVLEQMLLTAATGKKVALPSSISNLYSSDFNFDRLLQQLEMLADTILESGNDPKTVTNIRVISDAMNAVPVSKKLLPEVHKLLCLYYTIPVTTATAERCFSSLRRVKNYLRSTMTQMKLNDLMCGYIHKDYLVQTDVVALANDFAQRNNRRKIYFSRVH